MITSVRLQNWTSFGAAQTAPLEAITVLVGANNSGKSNFLAALRATQLPDAAALHRPVQEPQTLERELVAELFGERMGWSFAGTLNSERGTFDGHEEVTLLGRTLLQSTWTQGDGAWSVGGNSMGASRGPMVWSAANDPRVDAATRGQLRALCLPLAQARRVHLKADAIRQENQLSSQVVLGEDGAQLAALVARWTLELPERRDELNAILRRCLPEMKRIHAPPGDQAGFVKLVFEQADGERFDASSVSDGVVLFAALIAHALEAPENGLVLIEEPERGLHPRRLVELLDVLRTLVERRKTQFVLASHSPALLTLLRDEPEAVLLFRRTDTGTEIRRLSDVPELTETLARSDPGEMLAGGVFDEGYRRARHGEAAE